MSGHSKWHNIQARKKKGDATRGKVFTKIGRELAVAVKEGGADPDINNRLRDVIAKAKQNNMPSDNIARAIKKASGDVNSVNYENTTYEGYGIAGAAVIVECLTDNKNRTAGDVRHCFDKYGGGLGATGCVSYLFKRKGVIIIEKNDKINSDDVFMKALEAGAEDIQEDDDVIEIYTAPDNLKEVADSLEKDGIILASQEIDQIPDMYIELDENKKSTFEKMLEALEDLDDVQEIYHNVKLD
jgi:YebC/PmpR family DNA-binding regulatory protein